ncbi:serine/threonine protein kinase [Mycobacterium sp. MAA66]|uniref:serine/threonine-protein kinase n=1 Tax=Mycobacterium sp. MAA66 TaxID=3156297 RepID=UPI00351257E7
MPLTEGAVFAEYRILRSLGSGGMGQVYLAQHPRLPRLYALKVLPTDLSTDDEYRGRFEREADLAAGLYHPNIVGVHDRGEFHGQLWIAMDYVDGPDCNRLLRERYPAALPQTEALAIVSAIADALDYAHQRGLLHRDVKPANILLTAPQSGSRRILLADFGIARRAGDVSGLTATNFVVGTVNYVAPEQLQDQRIDGRADQYALAVTAYQLLTGAMPFQGSNPAVVIGQHLSAPPPSISDRRPELAPLDPVFATALAKNPQNRFARCSDFATALSTARSQPAARFAPTADIPPRALPPTRALQMPESPSVPMESMPLPEPRYPAKRSARRWALAIGALVLAALFFSAVTIYALWPKDRSSSSLTPAQSSVPTTSATAASITFDGMRDFVTAYYNDLPANPDAAWAKLDAQYQNTTGGQDDYRSFWASLRSVTLVSVSPRDASSVTARLRYVRQDGSVDTEDRWLRMALVDGVMKLADSARIGPAAFTTAPRPHRSRHTGAHG